MAAVRQHYKLATTGKTGQNANVGTSPKGGAKKGPSDPAPKKGGSYGGKMRTGA